MGFTFSHCETDSLGSFDARGTGFLYSYSARNNNLGIHLPRDNAHLIDIDLKEFSVDALSYTQYLEKATQINALMFSNSATIDLTETFDPRRLRPITRNAAVFAGYALNLEQRRFHHFSLRFRESCALEEIYIDSLYRQEPDVEYFKGYVKTRQGNAVSAGGQSVADVLLGLSEKILRDLIVMEPEESRRNSSNDLLGASFKLSTTSRILDKNYLPCHKLSSVRDSALQIKNIASA
ncbi:MAG TPA: hypothetical protein DEA55_04220 [Rhodospirillaceae bacterium]|nr:hypothetical protein [Rhodospirillaceae bacterium]